MWTMWAESQGKYHQEWESERPQNAMPSEVKSFWDQVATSIEKWKEYKSRGLQSLWLAYHFTGKLTKNKNTNSKTKTVPQILKDTQRNQRLLMTQLKECFICWCRVPQKIVICWIHCHCSGTVSSPGNTQEVWENLEYSDSSPVTEHPLPAYH